MLSFLAPLFLAGALAAAVPVVLHLLKREPESRVKFAVVRLLKRAPVEHTEKHRLRELLLLALRVAALVLLALAFARPFFPTGDAAGASGATVIALDTSYSMSGPGRFERARQLAKDAIARAPARDLVGVVTFADQAQIVMKPAADRVLASSAIDQAQPGFGATRYRSALSASAQSLPGRAGTIVVVTDLQESGWDAGDRASIPADVRIVIVDVGPQPPNLAVTAARSLGDRITATIRNTSPRPRDARVHLTVDGRAAGETTSPLGGGQSADVTFAAPSRGGSVAAISVDDPDGIQADNVRYIALAGSARPSVLLIAGSGDAEKDAFYVRHALAAGEPGGRGYALDVIGGAQLASGPGVPAKPGTPGVSLLPVTEDRLKDYAAVLLLSTRGLERRGREMLASYVRAGGGLLIASGPDVDGDVAGDVLGAGATLRIVSVAGSKQVPRTLAPADARHPVFRPFAGTTATLGLVRFQNAARIEGSGCLTLARFTTGDTALLECPAGEGRALVLASDLDNRWNDFPLHTSFVPFLHEAVRYVSSARTHASEYFVGDAPSPAPPTPGVHLVGGGRQGTPRRVAVNVDPRESDPARITTEEFESAVTRLKDAGAAVRVEAREREDRQHLWQYAIALMVVTLTVEGFIASRTG
jgi:hypothetical protein